MQTQRISLTTFVVPLLAVLYGCQPEGSTQQNKESVPVQPQAANKANSPAPPNAEAMKLAKDIGCFACHSLDKKLLGPSWKQVAAVYRHDPDGEAKLMNKVANGGSGVWGTIAMPGYSEHSEEKRRILVRFILSLE